MEDKKEKLYRVLKGNFCISLAEMEEGKFQGIAQVKDYSGDVYTGEYTIFKTGGSFYTYIAINDICCIEVDWDSSGVYSFKREIRVFKPEGLGSAEVKAAFDKKQEENMRAYKLKVHGDADRPLVREYKDLTKSKDESLTDYWGCNIVGM